MEKLIDIKSKLIASVLDLLLKDKTTQKNIIWATDTYKELGQGFSDTDQIHKTRLLQQVSCIKSRIQKSLETQQERTRKKAEVFTPAWLCNQMNNYSDEEWFGRKDVFNIANGFHTWSAVEEPIQFPMHKRRKIPLWQRYVDSRRLEITCGEAPYLVSRYDVSTGEPIFPLRQRIGQLDRKLRIVNENTVEYEEWVKWTIRAFEATYGYEYQGDNLLIARINLLLTFVDYYRDRWDTEPDEPLLKKIANRIVWNLWQMDGLKNTTPLGKPAVCYRPTSLFDANAEIEAIMPDDVTALSCKVYDWRRDNSMLFTMGKRGKAMGKKLFDFVIGNPPYQDNTIGENDTYAPPVYDKFLDAAYQVADKVEMIHPARFLFNAGSTPKAWNQKMLNDEHFTIKVYENDSKKVFFNTEIKGGIVISYRDNEKVFGAIEIFTPDEHLKDILCKVKKSDRYKSIADIIMTRTAYKLTDKMHKDYPNAVNQLSKGHAYDMSSNIFNRLPQIFYDKKPNDGYNYMSILGRMNNGRVSKYIRTDYVKTTKNTFFYKLVIPQASGSGEFGETISSPVVGYPGEGTTETFITVGCFNTIEEAENCRKYICTKICRAMLGILKRTQALSPDKWKYVPLQDFTSSSDIDWSQSIANIDKQLYKKYNLSDKEIEFIETHVKEMA